MRNPEPTIVLNADVANPGQFFACCGLLELADRLWPGAEGWFQGDSIAGQFCVWWPNPAGSLKSLLEAARSVEFDVDDADGPNPAGDDDDESGPVVPILITAPFSMLLDWWSEKSIKPWAGSMKERVILRAMLRAIAPDAADPFNVQQAVNTTSKQEPAVENKRSKSQPKKREPFYFDSRRGTKSHPLDSGWSPDTHKMEHMCAPAVEALCFFGLQRCRPMPTTIPGTGRYIVWPEHLPVSIAAAAVAGILPVQGGMACEFRNFFRTDQRKHKAFGEAKCLDR